MRLRTLIHRLQDLVTDPLSADAEGGPLSQILMNSHSPVVLSALKDGRKMPVDVIFADVVSVADPVAGAITRKTRLRPVAAEMLVSIDEGHVTSTEVERYLATVDAHA